MHFEAIVKSENSTDSTKYVDHKSHISLCLDLNPPAEAWTPVEIYKQNRPILCFLSCK